MKNFIFFKFDNQGSSDKPVRLDSNYWLAAFAHQASLAADCSSFARLDRNTAGDTLPLGSSVVGHTWDCRSLDIDLDTPEVEAQAVELIACSHHNRKDCSKGSLPMLFLGSRTCW